MNEFPKHRRHWSFVVTDKRYLYPVVATLTALGLYLSIKLNDPSFFQRIGNFVIGVGVWMSLRFTLREGINRVKGSPSPPPPIMGKNGPAYEIRSEKINEIGYSIGDAHLQLHGFFLVIYGSAIGSFGDYIIILLNKLC